jgi:hypothetical protein
MSVPIRCRRRRRRRRLRRRRHHHHNNHNHHHPHHHHELHPLSLLLSGSAVLKTVPVSLTKHFLFTVLPATF